MSDIDTEWVDSLKALDPERPIREADIGNNTPATIASRDGRLQIRDRRGTN